MLNWLSKPGVVWLHPYLSLSFSYPCHTGYFQIPKCSVILSATFPLHGLVFLSEISFSPSLCYLPLVLQISAQGLLWSGASLCSNFLTGSLGLPLCRISIICVFPTEPHFSADCVFAHCCKFPLTLRCTSGYSVIE